VVVAATGWAAVGGVLGPGHVRGVYMGLGARRYRGVVRRAPQACISRDYAISGDLAGRHRIAICGPHHEIETYQTNQT
jgi:hypothetical protein